MFPSIPTDFLFLLGMIVYGSLLIGEHFEKLSYKHYIGAYTTLGIGTAILTPFLINQLESPVYFLGILFSITACFSIAYILYKTKTTFNLFKEFTPAVIIFAAIYGAGMYIAPIRRILIEVVAKQTNWLLGFLGYDTVLREGPKFGYMSEIVYQTPNLTYITYIDIACTGIGAFAVVCGIYMLLDFDNLQLSLAMILSAIIIYILNLIRNVFVATAFFNGWFKMVPLPATTDPNLVSFTVAETYIAQTASSLLLAFLLYGIYVYTDVFKSTEEELERIWESV